MIRSFSVRAAAESSSPFSSLPVSSLLVAASRAAPSAAPAPPPPRPPPPSSSSRQAPQLSSFLHRLFDATEIVVREQQQQQQQQKHKLDGALRTLASWRRADSIDGVFHNTQQRFHSVRVPVQRKMAMERASSRKETAAKQRESGGGNDNAQNEEEKEDDPTVNIKLLSHEQAKLLSLKLDRAVAKMQTLKSNNKKRPPQNEQHPLFRLVAPQAIFDAVCDMREERFLEYMRLMTQKVRGGAAAAPSHDDEQDAAETSNNNPGVIADRFAIMMCRAWLRAQDSFGFGFPSTESFCSPLLPTMLVLAAARDPELYLELLQRMETARARLSSSAFSPSSSSSSFHEGGSILQAFGDGSLPGWIAAVTVAVHECIDHKKNLKLMHSNKSSSSSSSKDSLSSSPSLVDSIEKRLHVLLAADRHFTGSTRDVAQRVVPLAMTAVTELLTTVHRRAATDGSQRFSFVTGTRGSPSSFELWRLFAARICGVSSASCSARRRLLAVSSSSSSSSRQGRVAHSPVAVPMPSFFCVFLISVAQYHAATPGGLNTGSSAMLMSGTFARSNIDDNIDLAVGAMASHLAFIAAAWGSSSAAAAWGSSSAAAATAHFATYMRLLQCLSRCGCASWVMETVLKDSVTKVHATTAILLGHVVAMSFPTQKKLLEQEQGDASSVLARSDDEKNNMIAKDDAAARHRATTMRLADDVLRKRHKFLLMPSSVGSPSSSSKQQPLPVDTVTLPITNLQWNTLVGACEVVTKLTARDDEDDHVEKNSNEASCSSPLTQQFAEQLATTRIRCACLQLVHNSGHSALSQLVSAANKIRAVQSVAAKTAAAAAAEDDKENDNIPAPLSAHSLARRVSICDTDDLSAWCNFESVIVDDWLLQAHAQKDNNNNSNKNPLLALFGTSGKAVHSSRRAFAAASFFGALSDVLRLPLNPFCESHAAERLRQVQMAEAAAVIASFALRQFVSSESSSRKTRLLLAEVLPPYLDAMASVAALTKDAAWLWQEMRFIVFSKSGGLGGDLRLAARQCMNPRLLQAACAAICEDKMMQSLKKDVKSSNSNNNKDEQEDEQEDSAEKLQRLLRRLAVRGMFHLRFSRLMQRSPAVQVVLLDRSSAAATRAKQQSTRRIEPVSALVGADSDIAAQFLYSSALAPNASGSGVAPLAHRSVAVAIDAAVCDASVGTPASSSSADRSHALRAVSRRTLGPRRLLLRTGGGGGGSGLQKRRQRSAALLDDAVDAAIANAQALK